MKLQILRKLIPIACLLVSMNVLAYDFESSGIYYNITSSENKTAEVTYKDTDYNSYSGEVTIPSSVTHEEIEYSVTSIGPNAFSKCLDLLSVSIPNSVISIGSTAFYGCENLASVTIPKSVTSIGESSFSDCKNLISIIVESGSLVYDSRENCNAIIETATNTLISGCKKTIIPSSITTIGTKAFYYCTELSSILIPNSVTTIGNFAFDNCIGLTAINIPRSVTNIGMCAFQCCYGLSTILIPDSVTSIGYYAFNNCQSLSSIIVEKGNNIYDSRDNCNAIIESKTNTLIKGCKNTIIPTTITDIYKGAFSNCVGLTSITIPTSVVSIGDWAFYYCSELTSITMPNSVTNIGLEVFKYTDWYNNQPEGVIYLDNCCLGYKGAKPTGDLSIQLGTRLISGYAFSDCSGLTKVTIPDGVTSIGDQAFWNCTGLTNVTIPNSVTSIGEFTFVWCTSLNSVICESTTPPIIGDKAFGRISKEATLYVPNGSTDIYINALGWNHFTNIEEKTYTVTSIILDSTTDTLYIGDIVTLQAIITPTIATNQELVWTSSDENVATVDDNGLVTAVAVGSTTITATTTDGSDLSAVCEITVSEVYRFAAENATTFKGKSIMLPVNLVNSGNVSAFQFDVYLPEGITIPFDDEEEEYLMTLNPERATDTHGVLTNKQANGAIRYICNSSKSEAFAGESGTELFSIPLNISSEIEGEFNIEFKNIKLSSSDAEVRNCEDISVAITVKPYSLGDSNGDDNINIADIVNITNYVLGKPTKTFIEVASDVNKDGDINIGDVVGTVNLVLNTSTSTKSMISSKQVYQKAVAVEASSQESVFINDFTICANESKTIEVNMTNSNTYSGLEFNLHLPEGLTVDYDEEEEEYLFGKTSRLTGSHSINYNKVADNVFRFVIYSSSSKNIKLNEGAIMTIPFTASADMPEGGYQIEIKEVVVSTSEADDYEFENTIANVTVCPDPMTGINDIVEDNTEVEYYNLQGVKVAKENLTQGVYIKKKGTKAVKVMLK